MNITRITEIITVNATGIREKTIDIRHRGGETTTPSSLRSLKIFLAETETDDVHGRDLATGTMK